MSGFASRSIGAMIIASAAVISGCVQTHYQIEITPGGENFERKLTCWLETSGSDSDEGPKLEQLPKEELERIGKLYDRKESPHDAAKQTFVGRFSDTTPADVGGAGEYTHLTSPLGSVSSYVERFRGNDDLDNQLAQRRAAADRLVDLLIRWLEKEVGGRDGFPKLKKFLNEGFRKDLKNLGIYTWTGGVSQATGTKDALAEFVARIGLYLCERSYLKPKDIPSLMRALNDNDSDRLLELVKRATARKMGIADGKPLPECLAALKNSEQVGKSLDEYVRTTDAFKRRLEQWRAEKKENEDAKEPQPGEVVRELLSDALLKMDSSGSNVLNLKLHCGPKPLWTNGEWDKKAATVNWHDNIRGRSTLPVVCFATWVCPAKDVQKKHFGKLVLDGHGLAQYVIWYRGLRPEEMRQWDKFIGSCEPGKKLKERIEQFRFADDPKPDPAKPDEQTESLADTPRELIFKGFDGEDKAEDEPQSR